MVSSLLVFQLSNNRNIKYKYAETHNANDDHMERKYQTCHYYMTNDRPSRNPSVYAFCVANYFECSNPVENAIKISPLFHHII